MMYPNHQIITLVCVIIYAIIAMTPIVLIVNFTRLFYPQNIRKLRVILAIHFLIFLLFLILSVKITSYRDSLFLLTPIASIVLTKFGFNWFSFRFKEELINTFPPNNGGYPNPHMTKYSIHWFFNVLFVSLFGVIPMTCTAYFSPSNEFNHGFFKLLYGVYVEIVK